MEDVKFSYKKQTYWVSPQAYIEPNSVIVLPDGKLLYINGWMRNTDPPEPASFQLLQPLTARLDEGED